MNQKHNIQIQNVRNVHNQSFDFIEIEEFKDLDFTQRNINRENLSYNRYSYFEHASLRSIIVSNKVSNRQESTTYKEDLKNSTMT